jgi:hypothetical protein
VDDVSQEIETWDLWFPGPGASGLPFARARINASDAAERILVHAAPQRLQVAVRDDAGKVLATGSDLERKMPGPISTLVRKGAVISLEDGWPGPGDLGRVVILPGGEAGILKAWWHADDRKEWRWQVEFYNQIRESRR